MTKKDPMEADRLRWLASQVVEQFIADTIKNSTKIVEIVALGPVLEKESYCKLLSTFIKKFDDARILDLDLLQGLVQLVQDASPDYLVSDDLVKILGTLKVRLEGTHQQSTVFPYHLTLAVSRVLDVMADHKLLGLDRAIEHEPLSNVLLGLQGSSDPYLLFQASYAFQALQYVPNDESALQTVWRHSTVVVQDLVKVTAIFKLDLASVFEVWETYKKHLLMGYWWLVLCIRAYLADGERPGRSGQFEGRTWICSEATLVSCCQGGLCLCPSRSSNRFEEANCRGSLPPGPFTPVGDLPAVGRDCCGSCVGYLCTTASHHSPWSSLPARPRLGPG